MVEEKILKEYRTVAVVGASPNPERASHTVASYLMEHGYNVIPVNPTAQEVLGKTCYPDLISIPGPVEVVDIFLSSEKVMAVVEEAIKVGAKAVWMQLGIINEEAAALAREAGLLVVMDRCMKQEHQFLTLCR
ncbi:CoA-binding protein [Chloroflexota bacterium]